MEQNQAEKSWFMSESAFRALFYPLPACFMLAAAPNGMIHIDARNKTMEDALGTVEHYVPQFYENEEQQVHVENHLPKFYRDELKSTLMFVTNWCEESSNEVGKGVFCHQRTHGPNEGFGTGGSLAEHNNVVIKFLIQGLYVYNTASDASKYVGELFASFIVNPMLAPNGPLDVGATKKVYERAQEYGVMGIKNRNFRVYVVRGENVLVGCFVVVENIFMALVMQLEPSDDDVFIMITAKAIAHLYRKLVFYRSDNPSRMPNAPSFLPPDPHMCSYCGKERPPHTCARCKTFWYCSRACQVKHWEMDGPYSHKRTCEIIVDESVLPPAIPVGRLVMIHGLKSTAGQRLNGKDAFVVTQPTDNGRLGVVLEDDVSEGDIERLKTGNASWVPNTLQKAKTENLELVWTPKKK